MLMETGMSWTHLTNVLVNYDTKYIPLFVTQWWVGKAPHTEYFKNNRETNIPEEHSCMRWVVLLKHWKAWLPWLPVGLLHPSFCKEVVKKTTRHV